MPKFKLPIAAELPEPEHIDIDELASLWIDGRVDLICVLGPTASGKTRYAVELALRLEESIARLNPQGKPIACEILSADSRQVYRGMDIGTGKDLCEYGSVPYHLIDICEAGERYNVYRFQYDFAEAYKEIRLRGNLPILCGGTGLYIEAATRGYDFSKDNPQVAASDLPASTYYIGTLVDRETRNARIDARLDARLKEGMIEEIRGLLDRGVPAETLIWYGLEYKFVTQHILGETSCEYMREHLGIAIHQFAKRQMTWFRGMERDGVIIHWVSPE